jgi:NADP-dependent 3-hydroxy acid dehydrogenase YdfG
MIHGSQTPESIGWGALQQEQVADAVLYAVSRPKGMALNDVVLRPAAQPM